MWADAKFSHLDEHTDFIKMLIENPDIEQLLGEAVCSTPSTASRAAAKATTPDPTRSNDEHTKHPSADHQRQLARYVMQRLRGGQPARRRLPSPLGRARARDDAGRGRYQSATATAGIAPASLPRDRSALLQPCPRPGRAARANRDARVMSLDTSGFGAAAASATTASVARWCGWMRRLPSWGWLARPDRVGVCRMRCVTEGSGW
jgi:hypothetical protein